MNDLLIPNDRVVIRNDYSGKMKNLICKVVELGEDYSTVEVVEHKTFTICSTSFQLHKNGIVSKPQRITTVSAKRDSFAGMRYKVATRCLVLAEAIEYLNKIEYDYKWIVDGEGINELYLAALDREKAA